MADTILHYFGGNGRGEAIRMMLHHAGVAFDDKCYTFEQWAPLKESGLFEYKRMPMLEIDGHRLVETAAIIRYVATKYGFYSNESLAVYNIEVVASLAQEIAENWIKFVFPEYNEEGLFKWIDENLATSLGRLEGRLVSNNNGDGFFVGNSATAADFLVFQFLWDNIVTKEDRWAKYASMFDTHAPKVKAFLERFPDSSPTLKAYLDQKNRARPI